MLKVLKTHPDRQAPVGWLATQAKSGICRNKTKPSHFKGKRERENKKKRKAIESKQKLHNDRVLIDLLLCCCSVTIGTQVFS